jgi:hypothetical protein
VLLAIQLDHELRGVAVEVGNLSVERDLPPEFRAVEARPAQPRPEDILGARHLLAQGAGELAAL